MTSLFTSNSGNTNSAALPLAGNDYTTLQSASYLAAADKGKEKETTLTEQLLVAVQSLQTQLAEQNLKVTRLEEKLQVVTLKPGVANSADLPHLLPALVSTETAPASPTNSIGTKQPNERRRFLKHWGQAAAGLAAGAGALALTGQTQTAQAASGENLILGRSNLVSTSTYLSQLPGSLSSKPVLWSDWHATGKSTEPPVNVAIAGTADSSGVGGYFSGGRAPIVLAPGGSTPPPIGGTHTKGELYVTSNGDMYISLTDVTPSTAPTWRKFNNGPILSLLDYPTRFIDTRDTSTAGAGNPYGSTTTGLAVATHTFTLPTTSLDGLVLPSSGVVGIFGSIQAMTMAGTGSIKILPGDAAGPGYSVVSYLSSGIVESGAFCIKLPANRTFKIIIVGSTANFTLELFGYYT